LRSNRGLLAAAGAPAPVLDADEHGGTIGKPREKARWAQRPRENLPLSLFFFARRMLDGAIVLAQFKDACGAAARRQRPYAAWSAAPGP
jgi:hypothetical protein